MMNATTDRSLDPCDQNSGLCFEVILSYSHDAGEGGEVAKLGVDIEADDEMWQLRRS
jgi:hypothetical protein